MQTRETNENTLFLKLPTKQSLQMAYMPFIKNGGLFVETNKKFKLATQVTVNIQIMEEAKQYSIDGKVVWINPKCAQGGVPEGIGIQFVNDAENIRNKIVTQLANTVTQNNYTM